MIMDREFTANVVTTAVESGTHGIQYWADVLAYEWKGVYAEAVIMDRESGRPHMYPLTHEVIEAGINMIIDRHNAMRLDDSYRVAVRIAVEDNDAGQIDAELADQIVQAATLGDVVYG